MRDKSLLFKNYFYFLLFGIIFSALQCTLWPFLLANLTPPHFWLPILVYWAIYRQLHESIFMTYFVTFAISPFTAMPISLLLMVNISVAVIIFVIKSHFYQPGVLYFVLSNFMATFLFPFFHTVYSYSFEPTPIASVLFFDRLLQTLLTALLSFPLYQLFIWFDNLTEKKLPTETGRQFE